MCKQAAQLLRSAACLHTNQSQSYLNHLVSKSAVTLHAYSGDFSLGRPRRKSDVVALPKKKIKICICRYGRCDLHVRRFRLV